MSHKEQIDFFLSLKEKFPDTLSAWEECRI